MGQLIVIVWTGIQGVAVSLRNKFLVVSLEPDPSIIHFWKIRLFISSTFPE